MSTNSKPKKRKIKIVENKLGKRKALGLWEAVNDNTAIITIDERLKGYQRLLILTHECLHEVCPDWTEQKVLHVSEVLSSLLWKCDYRHVDHTGPDTPSYSVPKRKKKKPEVVKTYEKKARIKVRVSNSNKKMA